MVGVDGDRWDRFGVSPAQLAAPRGRAGQVARTSLLARLRVDDAPVVAFVAPAGYGKTVAMQQWCAASGRTTTWLTLDDSDDDPAAFVSHLAAALDAIDPIPDEVVDRLARPSLSDATRLRTLVMHLRSIRTPFVLALDHADALRRSASRDVLTALALNLPDHGRLAYAARQDPGLGSPRHRLEARTCLVDGADLRMDVDEARRLVAAMGLGAGEVDTTELVDTTEGWPIAMYLAVRSGRTPTDGWSGVDRLGREYIRSEILGPLDPHVRGFLVRTAVVDRFEASLCDHLMERTGSQQVLAELEHTNLLVVPLDERGRWYRYHHLLRDVLIDELVAEYHDEQPMLHTRAAQWFEAQGDWDAAVTHAQRAGDHRHAAELVVRHAVTTYAAGRGDAVTRWVDWFITGDHCYRYAAVAAAGGALAALQGKVPAALRLLDIAERADSTDELDGSPQECWIDYLRCYLGLDGPAQMRSDAERVLKLAHPTSRLRSGAALVLALAHVLDGHIDDADHHVRIAIDIAELGAGMSSLTTSLGCLASLDIERHDWAAADRHATRALEIVDRASLHDLLGSLMAAAVGARLATHHGDTARAEALVAAAHRLRPLCSAAAPMTTWILLQLAHAELERGDQAGVRAVLAQVDEIRAARPQLTMIKARTEELRQRAAHLGAAGARASSLTTAELRVVPMLATHLSLEEIGQRLYVSRSTVKTHAAAIYRKLGVSSRAEAVEHLARAGLLGPH